MTTNLKLELFDHANMKELLEKKVKNLEIASGRLRTLIDSLTESGLDWDNLTDSQLDIIQDLFSGILSDI